MKACPFNHLISRATSPPAMAVGLPPLLFVGLGRNLAGGAQADVLMSDEPRDPSIDPFLEGRYSNYVEVGFNAFEFLVEFGQFYSETKQPHTHTKIVMSPPCAKDLLETLQKSLLQYEGDYGGRVNTEMAALPTSEAPSTAAPFAARVGAAPVALAPPRLAAPIVTASSSQQFNDAVKAMVDVLKTYLPPAGPGLPAPSVSIASVTERSVGLNNRRGEDARAGFGVVELKGGRLDAVARFELWGAQPSAVEQAIQDLIQRVLADRDKLWTIGFLRVVLEGSPSSENVPALPAWRQTADVRVLYEFRFEDSDDSQGLIARIPIHINSTFNEATTVTDEMTRWDNQAAPALAVRGPANISRLSALVFIAGPAPGGRVTLTRTFEGATGPPTQFTTLATFLAGVSGTNPQRNAQLVFASWNNFMAIFNPSGSPVTLGSDSYSPLEVAFSPGIPLGGVDDEFEITYQRTAFEVNAVAYLRAK